MLKAEAIKYTLIFKTPGGTSRGILTEKDSWFIKIYDEQEPGIFGVGECSILKGLSYDDRPDLENKIEEVVSKINEDIDLTKYPALKFAKEMALLDLENGGKRILFPSDFTSSKKNIPINGLVWMGEPDFMRAQIKDKIEKGFNCIKLKIGALDFEQELAILKEIRKHYSAKDIEIRVDANGAFHPDEALAKLKRLADFDLHSIEQPIKAGQIDKLATLCQSSPLPIALDEELIGIHEFKEQKKLLEKIRPQYIILKPSLTGGFQAGETWINLANKLNIGWWITSALESNIGLNAIAQWTATLNNSMPQGLGTGQVFSNNFESPLEIKNGELCHSNRSWNLNALKL